MFFGVLREFIFNPVETTLTHQALVVVGSVKFLPCTKDILNLINNYCTKSDVWMCGKEAQQRMFQLLHHWEVEINVGSNNNGGGGGRGRDNYRRRKGR